MTNKELRRAPPVCAHSVSTGSTLNTAADPFWGPASPAPRLLGRRGQVGPAPLVLSRGKAAWTLFQCEIVLWRLSCAAVSQRCLCHTQEGSSVRRQKWEPLGLTAVHCEGSESQTVTWTTSEVVAALVRWLQLNTMQYRPHTTALHPVPLISGDNWWWPTYVTLIHAFSIPLSPALKNTRVWRSCLLAELNPRQVYHRATQWGKQHAHTYSQSRVGLMWKFLNCGWKSEYLVRTYSDSNQDQGNSK